MIKENTTRQTEYVFINIEDLVPENHLLRRIDSTIEFNFIYDKVRKLYSKNTGRPALDPVVMFKMFLIQYLFGIRSERQLVKEIQVNVAYRWFLGFSLDEKIPHHSVFSQNRRRRFQDSSIFKDIFETIVEQAYINGFVEGKVLYTDSTHIKANANKRKFDIVQIDKKPSEFLDELNSDINQIREEHGKKPMKDKKPPVENKTIKQSKTDPDSGFMVRDGKPKGFFYLDHRTVDNENNIITDVHITPGNVHDSKPYIDRLEYQIDRFKFNVEAVGIDAGYNTSNICKRIIEKKIFGVIGRRRFGGRKGYFRKSRFKYQKETDILICPNKCILRYKNTLRSGYSVYESKIEDCVNCPMKSKCVTSRTGKKIITRHVWEHYKDVIMTNNRTDIGKIIYNRRKETVERSFANSKQLHGYRYARFVGIEKMKFQAYMTAIAQNIKKISKLMDKKRGSDSFSDFFHFCTKIVYKVVYISYYRISFS